ncbi:right-handed parallel beta-helix repeat-containing protein [Klebsiella sp. NPDC088457]
MNKKIPLALALSSTIIALPLHADEPHIWRGIAFGQSTDVNFSSNVLPEKIGVNDVTIAGKKLTPNDSADLSAPVILESRGGKIANSHDGLTFFYTELSARQNFTLQATVTVDQFGPENGALPAAQEGAGLLVRDVIGHPRQQPLKVGYEEFPAAANMVMNAIMTQDKKDHSRVKVQAIAREGITQPWGNAGSTINRISYKENIDLRQTPAFQLRLARTDEGFITSWAPVGSDAWVSQKVPHADLIAQQDKERYYVGFFASRNAKITVTHASLATSAAHTVASRPYAASRWPLVMQIASGAKSADAEYILQARANDDGDFTLLQDEVTIGLGKRVKAGEMLTQPATLKDKSTFEIRFTPANGQKPVTQRLTVERISPIEGNTLYVSPQGQASAKGTAGSPFDLATAVERLPPGGKIVLAAGDYPQTLIPLQASGLQGREKTLQADGKAVVHGLLLDASYWHINGISVTDKSLRIQGSHNLIENVTAYKNEDTGIQISSPDKIGRPLWASYNRVVNSESFSNEDPGKINADGFAVKMRVGEGNRLEGCYSHDNIDDGFDLFNKIEDGANGVVVIENSIARNNTSNGFKLGGEGQPVGHEVRNSIATGNHLDGFTDNFNPGKLVVVNNVAVDNQRFNYIFRPSPYGKPETQGRFSNNLSLRSQPGKYDDAVVGNVEANNFFIRDGRSVNAAGKTITGDDYQTLALPDPLLRRADGSFATGNFLNRH